MGVKLEGQGRQATIRHCFDVGGAPAGWGGKTSASGGQARAQPAAERSGGRRAKRAGSQDHARGQVLRRRSDYLRRTPGGRPIESKGCGVQRYRSLQIFLFLGRRFARSEEHTSELQSLMRISYAVLCLKKKTETTIK